MTEDLHSAAPRMVLLAAGASRRLGFPKALAPLPGGTPLQRLSLAALQCDLEAPLIISGAHHAEIEAAQPAHSELIFHPGWQAGRMGSIQRAIQACPDRDLLLAPVDCPRVPAAVLRSLLGLWERSGAPAEGWLGPFVGGPSLGERRFGHPILIGRSVARWITALEPDTPLKALRKRCHPLLACLVTQAEILEDLDTPNDFERLCQLDSDRL